MHLIETNGQLSTIFEGDKGRSSDIDPFALAKQLLEPLLPIDPSIDAPFVGGLLGLFWL
jgi:hypothetical protein